MSESMDRAVDAWLHERPESGSPESLERTLAATRRVGQRPGWTFPERWLPMQLTLARTQSPRPLLAIATVALLILAVAATAFYVASQRRESSPLRNGAIVYEEGGELFIVDELGASPRQLGSTPNYDYGPVFSPTGDRVAFVRDTGHAASGIMTIRPDGSGLTELAVIPKSPEAFGEAVGRLQWASDGTTLIASTQFPGCCAELVYVLEGDGSPYRMLDFGDLAGPLRQVSWRPGDRHIAFLGDYDVYIANADGTNRRRLPIGAGEVFEGPVEWSPDGEHLSFWSGEPNDLRVTIADIDADGAMTGSHQLENSGRSAPLGEALGPTWSPDGSRLAVLQKQGSTAHVQILEPDGTGSRIEGPAITDLWPEYFAWSPDGKSLAVSGDALWNDPETRSYRMVRKAWSLDVASGEWTESTTPIETWQGLAP
jgi:WD40 repeat protein